MAHGAKWRCIKLLAAALLLALPSQALADIKIVSNGLEITGDIKKADYEFIARHGGDLLEKPQVVYLDSDGGDVAAAMEIGRVIRSLKWSTFVWTRKKCFSSCALIYIAGVQRQNGGTIGLHRPYLATSLPPDMIEKSYPAMLKAVRDYVGEMGVTDSFYESMVNTPPEQAKTYWGEAIDQLVPQIDPTHDEINTAYEARKYGTDPATMRSRQQLVDQRCSRFYWSERNGPGDRLGYHRCKDAILRHGHE
jgi:hypothetical protein